VAKGKDDTGKGRPTPPDAKQAIPPPTPDAAPTPPSPAKVENGSTASAPARLTVNIKAVCGGLTNAKAPIVVGARYEGLAFTGPTRVFDQLLDSWLSRAVDLGIIGSALGQIMPISLGQFHKEGKLQAKTLLLAGLGEPGRLAQDGVRFVCSNILMTVKAIGEDEFALPLLGTRRNEMPIGDAVRGLVAGISDGFERICALAARVTQDKEAFQATVLRPLTIFIVQENRDKVVQILTALRQLEDGNRPGKDGVPVPFPKLMLSTGLGPDIDPDPSEPSEVPTDPPQPVTYLRVTQNKDAGKTGMRVRPGVPLPKRKATPTAKIDPFPTVTFKFSALSETSVVPERDQDVNQRLLHDISYRLAEICDPPRKELAAESDTKAIARQREAQGNFFTNLVIPDDFRKLIEGPANVILEVDDVTAAYPWEMAGYRKLGSSLFLGTNVAVSRQYRTLLAPPPTSPPPLNTKLEVLIIADPAPGPLDLPGARREGKAIVEVLQRVRDKWRGQYEISVTLRMGPKGEPATEADLAEANRFDIVKNSSDSCDPLELAMLLVNKQYDVVHYAGHGMCKPETGQTGWIFSSDCVLSAKEIFRIRQVPRLVFANACFSAVATDYGEQRKHMAGLAQAFFGRGIPNYIGAGWAVDDDSAVQCARWFYALVLGLAGPEIEHGFASSQADATIGRALQNAREKVFEIGPTSSSWGAYQHYGHVGDRLVPIARPPTGQATTVAREPAAPAAVQPDGRAAAAGAKADAPATAVTAGDENLVIVNGRNRAGEYAFKPRSIDEIASAVLHRGGATSLSFAETRGGKSRAALPPDTSERLEDTGWGIVFPADVKDEVRSVLKPLIDVRGKRARQRLKELDYQPGEQARAWYTRHEIAPGSPDFDKVPYYLLLVGSPEQIPFEFQYLLGIEFAVGRLSFDDVAHYRNYVNTILEYEPPGSAVPNARKITYWGTRHKGDGATKLSSKFLLDPLINGIPGTSMTPINSRFGFAQQTLLAENATKSNLLAELHGTKPPALLFTASHGMVFDSGQAEQDTDQGALLCQDWPGINEIKREHYLTATDIDDNANVRGMVAFLFACFGAGTPAKDQFVAELSGAATAPPLAPKPFMAALPRRLLSHPNGGALAVVGHVDRAWGFSMQSPGVSAPQIGPFANSLHETLSGKPIGHAVCTRFGARYADLSAILLNETSPTSGRDPPDDRTLVSHWLERNDAQNYVLLGDPAAGIRSSALK